MLTNKVFIKKTRLGGVMKIVREHYLRDDICCGSEACNKKCEPANNVCLEKEPISDSKLVPEPHYIIPDTNVALHQVCFLISKLKQQFLSVFLYLSIKTIFLLLL